MWSRAAQEHAPLHISSCGAKKALRTPLFDLLHACRESAWPKTTNRQIKNVNGNNFGALVADFLALTIPSADPPYADSLKW